MPPKGINGRANMQKFQMNSKKYGGNPFKYASLVSSVGRASKGGMWNYIQKRTDPRSRKRKVFASGTQFEGDFFKAIDWWLAGGANRATVVATLGAIGDWDTSAVTNMDSAFFNGNRTSSVTGIAIDTSTFNENIGGWNTSNVTTMRAMFAGAFVFDQPIGGWNTSKVTNMLGMFYEANSFNKDISNWDVSNVQTMQAMFSEANAFNQDIGNWNVKNVTRMDDMFNEATVFNQDIGNWNVKNVTTMEDMFDNATNFNQDISNWDVSSVQNMNGMFDGASSFNQDLTNWDVSNVTDFENTFRGSAVGTPPRQEFGGVWKATLEALSVGGDIIGFYSNGTDYQNGTLPGPTPGPLL